MIERRIAVTLVVATLAALALAGVYIAGGQAQLEGALLGTSLGALGIAVVLWAKHLFPQEEVTDERPSLESRPEDRREFAESFEQGERSFSRRKLLSRLLAAAVGSFGLAMLFPVRSLGPTPGNALRRTPWRPGVRVVNEGGRPVRVGDLQVGGILTVFPQGHTGREDAATVLVRVEEDLLDPAEGRAEWSPQGHVAFSKICTHVGCPVGLYQETTHRLLCPCHQSTFDVLRGARPVYGPATRPLPQLPLDVDDEGFLVARSDFETPVGPGFWDIERK